MDEVLKFPSSVGSFFLKAFLTVRNSLCRSREFYGLSHTSLQNNSTWLNFGWWEFDELEKSKEDKFAVAAQKLASKLAILAEINLYSNSFDKVAMLDAGCGCGDAAIFWAKNNPNLQIEAVTYEESQAKMAKSRVEKESMTERIQVFCGDALEYLSRRKESSALDRVVSLDAVYHFQTRLDFIKLSYHWLTPGGKLVCSDICSGRKQHWLVLLIISKAFSIPVQNLITQHQLQLQLEGVGFINASIERVDKEVWVGFREFTKTLSWRLWHYKLFGYIIAILLRFNLLHYVLWTATKPQPGV